MISKLFSIFSAWGLKFWLLKILCVKVLATGGPVKLICNQGKITEEAISTDKQVNPKLFYQISHWTL